MEFDLTQLTLLLKAKTTITNPEYTIRYVSYDSRNIYFPSETLFFALEGRLDGHQYLTHAYERGIRNFIIKKNSPIEFKPAANYFEVENPISALQTLAKHHRNQFSLPIIAITGSNGKTIVKDWLAQLLDDQFFMIKSPRSYNSQIGVPISVLNIEKNHELGIFEAGISKRNEMQNLAEVIEPNIGILTNIGDAHDDGFRNREEKINEKIKLFERCETIICNYAFAEKISQTNKKAKIITWSIQEQKSDFFIEKIEELEKNYTTIHAIFENEKINFTIPFVDYPSIENAISCYVTLLHLKIATTNINKKIRLLHQIALRLEIKAGINQTVIINDAYSLDFTSLSYSLDFLSRQAKDKKTLIISDFSQKLTNETYQWKQITSLIEEKGISRVIFIGKKNRLSLKDSIKIQNFDSTDAFLLEAKLSDFQQETILLKGARTFEFEKIAAFLSLKAHRTVLEINLDALRHNLHVYSKYLNTRTKILVMVKASAYGSGSAEVAKLLEQQRIDYLGVAYADEGVALRKEGVKLPILVLNPEEGTFPSLLRYDLEPEIYCFSQFERFLNFLQGKTEKIGIHIKLDTGMHRLGFETGDIDLLVQKIKENKNILIKSIFSHLAASDAAEHDDFTNRQVNAFEKMSEKIIKNFDYQIIRHICNTGGIARFPQYHFDMVRLGIGIYGVDSNPAVQSQLQIVNTLKATISQIKYVPKGETIGYSRRGIAQEDLRIATISIGYADGLLRSAGNSRYSVGIQGNLAPIIGNVCMDMCMIDITHLSNVQEGDEVIIFGEYPTVQILADATQTIAYEVLTNVSDRVKRVYYSA